MAYVEIRPKLDASFKSAASSRAGSALREVGNKAGTSFTQGFASSAKADEHVAIEKGKSGGLSAARSAGHSAASAFTQAFRGNAKADVKPALAKAKAEARSQGRLIGRVSGSGFSGGFIAAGAKAAPALAGIYAAFKIGKFVKDSLSAASNLNESFSKTNVVFGKSAKGVHDFAKTAAVGIGQSRQQAEEATNTFGNLLRGVGLTRKEAAKASISMVKLASDLGSFNNVDPSQVLQDLQSGLVGETEPLRKYGINLNEAALKQVALANGIVKPTKNLAAIRVATIRAGLAQDRYTEAIGKHGKASKEAKAAQATLLSSQQSLNKATAGSVPQLTAQQRVLASRLGILKQTKLAQGDFARTAAGAANQQRILAAQAEDSKAKFGKGLLPILQKVQAQLILWGPSIQKGLGVASDAIAVGILAVAAKVPPAVDAIKAKWAEIAPGLSRGWDRIAPEVEADLAKVLVIVQDFAKAAAVVFGAAVEAILYVWNRWGDEITAIAEGAVRLVGTQIHALLAIVDDVVNAVAALFNGQWGEAWGFAKKAVSDAITGVKALLTSLGSLLQHALGAAADQALQTAKDIGRAILDGATSEVHKLPGQLRSAMGNIAGVVTKVANAAGNAAKNIAGYILKNAIAGLSSLAQLVWTLISDIPGKVLDVAKAAGIAAIGIGQAIISGVISGLSGLAGQIQSFIGSQISSALSHIDVPHFSPVDQAASKAIGKPIVKGAVAGLAPLRKYLQTDIERAISDALDAATSTATDAAENLGQIIGDTIRGQVGSAARTASGADAALSKFERDQDVADLQARVDQTKKLVELRTELADVTKTQSERDDIQSQINDTIADQEHAKLQLAAKLADESAQTEQDATEALATETQKRADALEQQFKDGLITADSYKKQLLALFKEAVPDFGAIGSTLGQAVALQFSDALKALQMQLDLLAKSTNLAGGGIDLSDPNRVESIGRQLTAQRGALQSRTQVAAQLALAAAALERQFKGKKSAGGADITDAEQRQLDKAQAQVDKADKQVDLQQQTVDLLAALLSEAQQYQIPLASVLFAG